MEFNILLAGVGGQGILTIAQAVSQVALRRGFHVKQSEVHGMSQRGGSVQAHLRIADNPLHSDLIPLGRANMLLGVEPLEVLRYTEYLAASGVVVSSSVPLVNISDYPPIENVLDRISRFGDHVLIDSRRLAQVAGSARAENMVMLGAALRFMEFELSEFDQLIEEAFAKKGERTIEINRRALRIGHHAAGIFRDAIQRGHTSRVTRNWLTSLPQDRLSDLALTKTLKMPEDLAFHVSDGALAEIDLLFDNVRAQDRQQLYEHEVYRIVDLAGAITPPRYRFVQSTSEISSEMLDTFPGDRVVLKIVSPVLVHKTESNGLAFVPKDTESVCREMARLIHAQRKKTARIEGVLVVEFVEQAARGVGSELFVGIRQTREFGPVIAAGLGGVDTEYMASKMSPGVAVAKAAAADTSAEEFFLLFQKTAAYEILAGKVRGHTRRVGDGDLLRCFRAFLALARRYGISESSSKYCIGELEVNPFAFRAAQMVPLDGRGRLGEFTPGCHPRPLEKVAKLLEPKSIAVVGVSAKKANFGRVILNNIQNCGFPSEHLYVVKKNEKSIDAVPCVPSLADLPEHVDMVVAATAAEYIPGLADQVLYPDKQGKGCSSIILIPGGLGEKEGTQDVQEQLRVAIRSARSSHDQAPVFLGGNCMGIRSRPGKYDTFFIPESKLDPRRSVPPKRVAIISQSGAFIISRLSNLEFLDPRFAISAGNQVDLTVSDLLHAMAIRSDIDCIGVYVEGFQDLDGLEFLRAVAKATAAGKTVVFYKAGRTAAGRDAAQGHTASVAGDYEVCQAAVASAGAIVTDTFKEFEQILELSTDLHSKRVSGVRLGIISNAGYEAVGMADSVRGARYEVAVADLTDTTRQKLNKLLGRHGLDGLVDSGNPMDLTPMADDAAYEACVRAMLEDETVDALLVGCIPLTPRLLTTPDEISCTDSLAKRIPNLCREQSKPLVFIVDCAQPYDAFAREIRSAGIPVFRTADQAVRSVARYLSHRTAYPTGAECPDSIDVEPSESRSGQDQLMNAS